MFDLGFSLSKTCFYIGFTEGYDTNVAVAEPQPLSCHNPLYNQCKTIFLTVKKPKSKIKHPHFWFMTFTMFDFPKTKNHEITICVFSV